MPGMDGFETAALIHQHPRFEKTPIIFVTGVHVTDLDRLKGYELGAVDYVYVPVVPEILRSKVAVLVELYLPAPRARAPQPKRSSEANAELAPPNRTLQAREGARARGAQRARSQDANASSRTANARCSAEIAERERAEQAPARGRPPQGRVPRDARARAAQSARADQTRSSSCSASARTSRDRSRCREVIGARSAPHAARRRPARRLAHHAGKIHLQAEPLDLATLLRARSRPACPRSARAGTSRRRACPATVRVAATWCGSRRSSATCSPTPPSTRRTAGGSKSAAPAGEGRASHSVRDNGIGIASEILEHVFELFAQVRNPAEHAHGGLGIGLALVRGSSRCTEAGSSAQRRSGSRQRVHGPTAVAAGRICKRGNTRAGALGGKRLGAAQGPGRGRRGGLPREPRPDAADGRRRRAHGAGRVDALDALPASSRRSS